MSTTLSGFSFKDVSIFSKRVGDINWSIDGNQLAVVSLDKTYKILQVYIIRVNQALPSLLLLNYIFIDFVLL